MKISGRVTITFIILLSSVGWIIYSYSFLGLDYVHLFVTLVYLLLGWLLGYHYDKVRFMSERDHLTGVYNRTYLESAFPRLINNISYNSESGSLLYIDLDSFKQINDQYGHGVGDHVLKTTTARIQSCTKKKIDFLVRQGGDEFILILNNISLPQTVVVAERILAKVGEPIHVNDVCVVITLSIGISQFPSDGTHLDDLVKKADSAMYAAKRAGKNMLKISNELNDYGSEKQK